MIVGITGTLSSGKGTVVEFLKQKGFKHYSVRDFLVKEIEKRNLVVNRDSMVNVANELRAIHGASFIIEKLYERASQVGGNSIIESIRTVGEVEALRQKPGFILIAVDAEQKIRYQRALNRETATDNISYEKFLQDEQREMVSDDPLKQNLKKCIEMSDIILLNNSTKQELFEKLEKIFDSKIQKQKISKRTDYISWDEYFMGIALLSAQRSKDPNTQIGACIVDDKNKILGIGYNGFPVGCSDDELPWARKGNFLDVKYTYVCHAELNAIVNSINKNLDNCKIYVLMFPCNECAKIIIQSGIKEVIYLSDKYSDTEAVKAAKIMFDQAGIKYRKLNLEKQTKITLNFDDTNV